MINIDSFRSAWEWWTSSAWQTYEVAYGEAPGTRARLLASAPWQTRLLDLTQSEKELWHGLRKSYKALIHTAERRLTLDTFIGPGARGLIWTCQRVHHFAHGRSTRSETTWDLMGDWADDGRGLMAMAFDDQNRPPEMQDWPPCVDFAYFIMHGDWAYYMSAGSLRLNIHHAVIWTAIKALKDHNITIVELGWQGHALDEKGKAVEFLKRGFGGYDVPISAVKELTQDEHGRKRSGPRLLRLPGGDL